MEDRLSQLAKEINELRRKDHTRQVEVTLEIGRRLVEAEQLVPVGEWTRWRSAQLHLSSRSVDNIIALARLHELQPASFRQLSRLGLNKLYRIASLPDRFLKRLKPQTVLRIPGMQARKSLEEMNPVELNICARKWTSQSVQKRPNQMAGRSARAADKLKALIERLLPRLNKVRVENRRILRESLKGVERTIEACRVALSRVEPAA